MKKRFTILMMVAVAVGVLVPTAHADFVLYLQDDAGDIAIVTDGGPNDSNPDPGVITFNSPLGAEWIVNVTTGISKPVFAAVPPKMDLNSVNVSSAGPAELLIALTDTDFSLPADVDLAALTSEIGGTTDGTIELLQILDACNREFAGFIAIDESVEVDSVECEPFVLDSGLLGPGAFDNTQTGTTPVDGPFSLTEAVVIFHPEDGVSVTSFNAVSTVVPVPAAFLLGFLGLGVAGLGLRRKVS